ncbi:MAG: hypothetical protein KC549_11750, partial [Myxococcales bacterium]|nr:hypothetical protein [Myxococcales bacterium]
APAPVEGLLAAHGFGRPAADARLDAAAADLARRVDLAQGDVAAGQLQFVLDQAGVVDAWVMPFSVV